MIAVKGIYNGTAVILDNTPITHKCEVIVTFLDSSEPLKYCDDGSLSYFFKDYIDDGIREPLIDFGEAIGKLIYA